MFLTRSKPDITALCRYWSFVSTSPEYLLLTAEPMNSAKGFVRYGAYAGGSSRQLATTTPWISVGFRNLAVACRSFWTGHQTRTQASCTVCSAFTSHKSSRSMRSM